MSKKKKNNQLNDVVKALRRAERELQLERNGYDHPWVAMTITHKNKKAYDRKRDRKNFNYDSDGLCFLFNIFFFFFIYGLVHNGDLLISKSKANILIFVIGVIYNPSISSSINKIFTKSVI